MEFIREYSGPLLNPNDMIDPIVKQAYISWREQRTRCYNKKREKYKNYGAKGIEVKYTSRQFIAWWIKNIKSFTGKKPTIGRIDHTKNYEFGNVEIQDLSENSQERNRRVPPFLKAKRVLLKSGSIGICFESQAKAAKFLKTHPANVCYALKRQKNIHGYGVSNV